MREGRAGPGRSEGGFFLLQEVGISAAWLRLVLWRIKAVFMWGGAGGGGVMIAYGCVCPGVPGAVAFECVCESKQLPLCVCSSFLCECLQTAASLWVTRSACVWVHQLCMCLCVSLWCLWAGMWMGVTVFASTHLRSSSPWSVLRCLWSCGHGWHLRGPGQAVHSPGGGASSVACPATTIPLPQPMSREKGGEASWGS